MQEQEADDFSQDFAGASVQFDQFGHVFKVSLPTDFSLARIAGLPAKMSHEGVVGILRGLGFDVSIDCVRILGASTSETIATVKVEDPSFAKTLSGQAQNEDTGFKITAIPVNVHGTNCRKVFTSWHKSTRSVWVNFGNGDIANRVAQRFNDGRYKCLGHRIKASAARKSPGRGGFRGGGHNALAWTVVLSDVPSNAKTHDIERAIAFSNDKPRHIEMGSVNHNSSPADVSVMVRLHLEEYGPLENFYLAPTLGNGKRVKACAWFQDEADARSACALNNKSLKALGQGKLTVTLQHTAKVKVPNPVFRAWKSSIEEQSKPWKDHHLSFHIYPAGIWTTLKVEGENAKDVADAGKILRAISSGTVLVDGANPIWATSLSINGDAYQKLKSIERELRVAIQRIRSKRQLLYYGPPDKLQLALLQVSQMLSTESSSSYEVELTPQQFGWMMCGGYNSITTELGKSVAVLDIVSKKLTITGTEQQYADALAMIQGKHTFAIRTPNETTSKPEGTCPICFCEAENAVRTSCGHTYCLDCFEDHCKSTADTSKEHFRIKCQGDGGDCSTFFALHELKDHLSSSVLEAVLESSFHEHVQRHPDIFHYCPTPDCGFIYRCTLPDSKALAYQCPNCLKPVCTSCHAVHGEYTCAEYKDIASGGKEALEKLKKELNIKDCPKCKTPMEKTEGCNHMTCLGCKSHVCWVCMAFFDASTPCYDHMLDVHKSIGLGGGLYVW